MVAEEGGMVLPPHQPGLRGRAVLGIRLRDRARPLASGLVRREAAMVLRAQREGLRGPGHGGGSVAAARQSRAAEGGKALHEATTIAQAKADVAGQGVRQ